MIRNIIGILFFVVSGFFVYMVGLMAFFNFSDHWTEKAGFTGVLCILMVLSHLIGLLFYRGASWKTATGITLVAGSSLNALLVVVMFSIKASPEITSKIDTRGLDSFSDYITGFSVMSVFVGLGLLLILLGRSVDRQRNSVTSDVTVGKVAD